MKSNLKWAFSILVLILLFFSTLLVSGHFPFNLSLSNSKLGKIVTNTLLGNLSSSYNSDPQNLTDGQHILFVDKNNPNCSNSNTRTQALDPHTPWCDTGAITVGGTTFGPQPGDTVLFRAGTYTGEWDILIKNPNNSTDYTVFKPYNNEEVRIQPAKVYSGWTQAGNIYSLDLSTMNVPDDGRYMILIKRNDYPITRVNSLEELSNQTFIAKDYDLYFYDSVTKKLSVKLVTGNSNDIFIGLAAGNIQIYSPNIELNGFIIEYGAFCVRPDNYAGLSWADNTRIINNTIMHCGQGILDSAGTNLLIDGNNISVIGSPFQYNDGPGDPNRLISDNKDHAIYYGHNPGIIRNNHVSSCYGVCIQVTASNPTNHETIPHNVAIYDNFIEGGLDMSGVNNFVYNNIIQGDFYPFTSYTTSGEFVNNLIIASGGHAAELSLGGIGNYTFKNNILISPGYCIETTNTNLSTSDFNNNLYSNQCGYFEVGITSTPFLDKIFANFTNYQNYMKSNYNLENNSIFADPLLNPDFTLQSGSPAIGAGTCLPEVTTDYNGNPRPTTTGCDIGPFQHTRSGSIGSCGDGVCSSSETCSSCPSDCGSCQTNPPTSGNGDLQSEPTNLASTSVNQNPATQNGTTTQIVSSPNAKPASVASVSTFTHTLSVGVRSSQVTKLQTLLSKYPSIYPNGKITGYYGPATFKAVGKFQIKYKVVSSSKSAGYGVVGPKTRTQLNKLTK